MNVLLGLIALVLAVAVVEGRGVRSDDYEPVMPIKYFFHLL
jgi:hypothetical protein